MRNNNRGYDVQIQSDECVYLVNSETYYKYDRKYFVGEDGIRYGHEAFSKMILPKEVFIEAYNTYIKK